MMKIVFLPFMLIAVSLSVSCNAQKSVDPTGTNPTLPVGIERNLDKDTTTNGDRTDTTRHLPDTLLNDTN